MKTLVVGHRGTGKTAFLKRVEAYYRSAGRDCRVLDLDESIVAREKQSVSEIFAKRGEAEFRRLEREVLSELAARSESYNGDVFVSAGAGFEGGVPPGWSCLWLRRQTDMVGRIFTDRPRLIPDTAPLDEYFQRSKIREPRYQAMSDRVLTLPEGFIFENEPERDFVLDRIRQMGGAITLLATDFRDEASARARLEQLIRMGVDFVELRDDLLSEDQIRFALDTIGVDRALVSFRNLARRESTLRFVQSAKPAAVDWPSEWGAPPESLRPSFVSLHARDLATQSLKSVFDGVSKLEAKGRVLKIAVPVQNLHELAEGHRWWEESPQTRVFLPMSSDGRWSWYRLWMKNRLALNFVREGYGSAFDQPLMLDWMRRNARQLHFAAVLGDPVQHSYTPAEQSTYFATQEMSVFAIRVTPEEWQNGGLRILQQFGLRAAAVTAPLKELAFAACEVTVGEAERLQAVNTLLWKDDHWLGTNTDLGGLQAALDEVRVVSAQQVKAKSPVTDHAAIWGGGGTLGVMEEALPNAVSFSARTGEPREDANFPSAWQPDAIVWAVGRSRWNEGTLRFPPSEWRPNVVIDLNYSEDSPGREYALMCGARYVSGLTMFRRQAELQRKFWSEYGGE